MNNTGITGYGGYVPRLRMQRAAIAAAHAWMAPSLRSLANGQRAFCSWDEDSITMAVEAARDCLDTRPRQHLRTLLLASTRLPFADLQNASLVAGALDLPRATQTLDIGHSQRAGVAALLLALNQGGPALVIASDHPAGKPASTQEMTVGAGAAAFTLGSDGVIAQLLGSASSHNVFIDHFRAAGRSYDYAWEERWVRDEGVMKLVPDAVRAALADAGVQGADVDHFVMALPLKGSSAAVAAQVGIAKSAVTDALDDAVGHAGSAHACLMLALALERARPGQLVVVVGFGQGCDVLVLRTTDALDQFRPRRGVAAAVADAQVHDAYLRLLSYGDAIDLEWGMRAERVVRTALTEQYRAAPQIAAFTAGTCGRCGTVQFPQMPTCVQPGCGAPRAQFVPTPLLDEPARVLTHTADWLSYHPAPPLVLGFVQFDNGARLLMEMVDVGATGVDVGTPLRSVLRIKDIDRTRGYPRYFWKATPLAA